MKTYDVIIIEDKGNFKPYYFIDNCEHAENKIVVADLVKKCEEFKLLYKLVDENQIMNHEEIEYKKDIKIENTIKRYDEILSNIIIDSGIFDLTRKIVSLKFEQTLIRKNMSKVTVDKISNKEKALRQLDKAIRRIRKRKQAIEEKMERTQNRKKCIIDKTKKDYEVLKIREKELNGRKSSFQ